MTYYSLVVVRSQAFWGTLFCFPPTLISAALQVTFAAQGSGASPSSLPAPSPAWALKYQRLAQDVGLDDTTLPVAFEHARQFLDPILRGQTDGAWSPIAQAWL